MRKKVSSGRCTKNYARSTSSTVRLKPPLLNSSRAFEANFDFDGLPKLSHGLNEFLRRPFLVCHFHDDRFAGEAIRPNAHGVTIGKNGVVIDFFRKIIFDPFFIK